MRGDHGEKMYAQRKGWALDGVEVNVRPNALKRVIIPVTRARQPMLTNSAS